MTIDNLKICVNCMCAIPDNFWLSSAERHRSKNLYFLLTLASPNWLDILKNLYVQILYLGSTVKFKKIGFYFNFKILPSCYKENKWIWFHEFLKARLFFKPLSLLRAICKVHKISNALKISLNEWAVM